MPLSFTWCPLLFLGTGWEFFSAQEDKAASPRRPKLSPPPPTNIRDGGNPPRPGQGPKPQQGQHSQGSGAGVLIYADAQTHAREEQASVWLLSCRASPNVRDWTYGEPALLLGHITANKLPPAWAALVPSAPQAVTAHLCTALGSQATEGSYSEELPMRLCGQADPQTRG